eukprot:jgi/Picre1/28594/NNA_003996.t1
MQGKKKKKFQDKTVGPVRVKTLTAHSYSSSAGCEEAKAFLQKKLGQRHKRSYSGGSSSSGVEEREALVQSVQSVEVPTSIRLKGCGFIVVRRETSFIFGVGHRKKQSVSLHSLYGGVLVVTYSRVSSPSLQAVLGALMA